MTLQSPTAEAASLTSEALHRSELYLQQSNVLAQLAKSKALESGDLKAALQQITEAAARTLEVELVNVWLYNEDRSKVRCVDAYERGQDRHSEGQEVSTEDYPCYFSKLEEGRTIAADDAFSDPRTKEFLTCLSAYGILSMLDAPIWMGGRLVGVLCHKHIGPPRHWRLEEQNFAGSMADFVSLTLESNERKKAVEALRESSQFNQQIIATAREGIIVYDREFRYLVWNPYVEELTGLRAGEVLGKQPWELPPLQEKHGKVTLQKEAVEGIHACLKRALTGDTVLYDDLPVIFNQTGLPGWTSVRFGPFRDAQGEIVGVIATVWDITERKRVEESLRRALEEVERLKNQIEAEKTYLQHEIKVEHNFEEIIGRSPNFIKILHQVEQVASTDATVLILGETGTGKELIARAIHNISPRRGRTLVKVNCASLPENLIESELFGHEKGAFTGALSCRIGRFELADGGTIFLDEIGDLPLGLQVKLLRVLQEGEFERLGCSKTHKVNVRVIAATNRDLDTAAHNGTFRKDLYFRLNVFPIMVPPLRERKEDIPLLVKHFVSKHAAKSGKKIDKISKRSMAVLSEYHWPGNIRELENVIERAIIISPGPTLEIGEQLTPRSTEPSPQQNAGTLRENEQMMILRALEESKWIIEGRQGAAKRLDISPSTLRDRMKKYGIQRPRRQT